MDGYREHPADFEPAFSGEGGGSPQPLAIGSDERRMHVRAYNYWASLLDGRDYPSVEDLEPADLKDFAPNSVLLDFTAGRDNPATSYIGEAIRAECGLDQDVRTIAEVPGRSLLSRLTDHYLQIIANRAPVGFEAEFVNQRGEPISYRGILMPLSSDGDTIDFIYGVISWKAGEQAPAREAAAAEEAFLVAEIAGEPGLVPDIERDEIDPASIHLAAGAGLGDRLWAAREQVEAARAADGRSRAALYRALGHAFDLALASKADPGGYAELLEDSGVKPQARAPMTAIAKLVFGADYDKARLTEFAAALAYAERIGIGFGGFVPLIEAQAGGLKALVAAERQARRPAARTDRAEAARSRLRRAEPLAVVASDSEFALVLTRRSADGSHELVALVEDEALVERAIRAAA